MPINLQVRQEYTMEKRQSLLGLGKAGKARQLNVKEQN